MLKPDQISALQPRMVTLQVICGGLIMGVVTATGLLTIVQSKPINAALQPLPLIGVAATVMAIGMAAFIPVMVRKQAVKQLAEQEIDSDALLEKMLASFQSSKIIGYALLEGPAFLNAIGWFLESSIFSIGAVILILGLMAMGFPTPGRIIGRIESMINERESIRDGR